jgi:sugar O-acyltransferase (sialic acid O-acetyltransferase NeuD family)
MNKIAIIGAGGFGREMKFLIEEINKSNQNKYEIIGYFDDRQTIGTLINGIPIIGNLLDLEHFSEKLSLVIALGDPITRRLIFLRLQDNKYLDFPNLIHPTVIYDEKTVTFGIGCIVSAYSILTVNIELNNFVLINLMCTIGHDSILKSFCSLMPNVNISGDVILNEGVYCGTGVRVINKIIIDEFTIVGAGAIVTKNLPKNCTAVGIPARPVKFN